MNPAFTALRSPAAYNCSHVITSPEPHSRGLLATVDFLSNRIGTGALSTVSIIGAEAVFGIRSRT